MSRDAMHPGEWGVGGRYLEWLALSGKWWREKAMGLYEHYKLELTYLVYNLLCYR